MGDLKPGRIFRPDLSQQWYFTARYRDHGHGQFEAITKHPVENSAELKAGHQAPRQLQRLAELVLTDITRRLRADQQVTHDAAALTPMSRLVRGDSSGPPTMRSTGSATKPTKPWAWAGAKYARHPPVIR